MVRNERICVNSMAQIRSVSLNQGSPPKGMRKIGETRKCMPNKPEEENTTRSFLIACKVANSDPHRARVESREAIIKHGSYLGLLDVAIKYPQPSEFCITEAKCTSLVSSGRFF